jgi:hypothetical protein
MFCFGGIFKTKIYFNINVGLKTKKTTLSLQARQFSLILAACIVSICEVQSKFTVSIKKTLANGNVYSNIWRMIISACLIRLDEFSNI